MDVISDLYYWIVRKFNQCGKVLQVFWSHYC